MPAPGTKGGTPGSGGTTGNSMPGNTAGGTGSNGTGNTGGQTPVTVPGNAGATMMPRLPGGGVASNTPLAPGCTAASANECPSITGACATGSSTTSTVTKFGTLCLSSTMTDFKLPAGT